MHISEIGFCFGPFRLGRLDDETGRDHGAGPVMAAGDIGLGFAHQLHCSGALFTGRICGESAAAFVKGRKRARC